MNPPISSDAPVRHAPTRARRVAAGVDGRAGRRRTPYRPAHAAPARPAAADHAGDLVVDLTIDGDEVVVCPTPKLFDQAAVEESRPPAAEPAAARIAAGWVRRHVAVQLIVPCLALAVAGLVAVVAVRGVIGQLGQVVLTASLVTAGVAWAQAIGDQRRRQQDVRFRLATGNLERADLTGTVLDGFTLWGQNLRGAKLSGCSADYVLLSGADLRDASMSGASLRVASLAGADLTDAHLFRSDLRGADLTGAVARGASFEQAVLRGALLDGADLSGADLCGADLRGAMHDEDTNWAGVVVSDETRLPEDLPPLRG